MNVRKVRVLLVIDGARNAPILQAQLERRGCDVVIATSYKEASEILKARQFDLVLSEFLLSDGTAYRLIPLLRGIDTTMFSSNVVEDGYWWMLALYEGEERWGEPGMRPAQFGTLLDQIVFHRSLLSTDELACQRPMDGGKDLLAQVRVQRPHHPEDVRRALDLRSLGFGEGEVPCEIRNLIANGGI